MKKFLMMAFAGMFAVLFLCGCDSPKKGFYAWRDAIVAGKVDAANKRTIKSAHAMNGLMVAALADEKDEKAKAQKKEFSKMEVVSVTQKGDKATLKIKGSDGKTEDFEMVKEDGTWKVAPKK